MFRGLVAYKPATYEKSVSGYVELANYLLQFLCYVISYVKFWHILFFLFISFLSTIKISKATLYKVKQLGMKQLKNGFTDICPQENASDGVLFSSHF